MNRHHMFCGIYILEALILKTRLKSLILCGNCFEGTIHYSYSLLITLKLFIYAYVTPILNTFKIVYYVHVLILALVSLGGMLSLLYESCD